jgi:hypothetical protein
MGRMRLQDEATTLPTLPSTISSPTSPAEAFAQFVELIRKSPAALVGVPAEDFLHLLRPFIINPARNGAAVRQIVEAFGIARASTLMAPLFKPTLKLIGWMPGRWRLKGTVEQFNPTYVDRLRALETMLKKDLLPGSVAVYVKPVQYLETPPGYGLIELHRYRVIVQTLVDPSEADTLARSSTSNRQAVLPGVS